MLLVGIALISTFAITKVHLNQLYNSEGGIKTLQTDGLGGWQLVTQSASQGSIDFSLSNTDNAVGIPLTARADNLELVSPTKTHILITSTGNQDITGIDTTGVTPYTPYLITNNNAIGGSAIKLKKQNNNSLAVNQFLFKDDMQIEAGEFYIIYYNTSKLGWYGLLKP